VADFHRFSSLLGSGLSFIVEEPVHSIHAAIHCALGSASSHFCPVSKSLSLYLG
jgi:hypothetical protein